MVAHDADRPAPAPAVRTRPRAGGDGVSCSCTVSPNKKGGVDIRYCPLHGAASHLLEALRGAVLSVEWRSIMHGLHGFNPDPEAEDALTKFALKCRAVIAKAEAYPTARAKTPIRTRRNSRAARGG